MGAVLRHLFTCSDNTTWDIGRFIWAKLSLGYLVLTALHVWHGGAFDSQQWAAGAGMIMTGGGASLVLKRTTEPQ